MGLTTVQERTLERLIALDRGPTFAPELATRLRDRIASAVLLAELAEPLWLSKGRLTHHQRCDGRFEAALRREEPPFEHTAKTAAGLLMHKAIELDVGCREELGAAELVERSVARLVGRGPEEDGHRDEAFASFWEARDELARGSLLMRAEKAVTLFRETFPPLRALRSELAPMVEWHLRAELAGGDLVLDGRVDLSLGRQPPAGEGRALAGRLLIDLKGEGAWPEHVEDMRFYALVHTLRFGVPPARVATVFLESGEWQVEDVSERGLLHATDRVIAAVRTAAALLAGREPELRPGPYCGWCPRSATCPAAPAGS